MRNSRACGSHPLICVFVPVLLLALVEENNAQETHRIQANDPALAARIVEEGGKLIADYGSYQLYETPQLTSDLLKKSGVELRDEYNFILLNAGHLDTRKPEVKALRTAAKFTGKRMHLVQFIGPVQPPWRNELLASGVQIVTYIPHHTYLVYGDYKGLTQVHSLATNSPHIQWDAPYLNEYKVHPLALPVDEKGNPRQIGTDLFSIQLVADAEANSNTVAAVARLALEPIREPHSVLNYMNLIARLSPDSIKEIAARGDVVSIQPYFLPRKFDERQDQIIAGNLLGNLPSGPGYLTWLAGKGFTQAQFAASGFAVDLTDSGIDNGTTVPNHFGLYVAGIAANSSRVIYNRLEGTPNPGSTLKGCDGHGNLNAHIIGGYDDLSGFPFADTNGFHYGLGVCPFVKLGSSVVFDPDSFTFPDYENLQSEAYESAARISNNSWGSSFGNGAYTSDAQRYDALVRDAQPVGSTFPAAGNQEMLILFAVGNNGPGPITIASPSTAKNVITLGASENVQSFGGSDQCGVSDALADSANDIASFSSRGPCTDGRHKPDIVAPGTHISGGVPQAGNGTADPCFNGNGVCGGVSPSIYFPGGQQFYTASDGTTHSTACVAGACALVRQYFINNFPNPPSPAMTKAYLMNSARYITGVSTNDTLWSNSQGMGELNLGMAFDSLPRILRDEIASDLFTASGQLHSFTGVIWDTNQPFRVTLAWTDAPGSTTGNAYINNLDLVVTIGGNTYKGNVFNRSNSITGGAADVANNVESVFLPAGLSGSFTVTVNGTGINGVGVPNPGNFFQQDFALVIYNATVPTAPVVSPSGAAILSESCFPTNNTIDPGETVTVNLLLHNLGTANTTNLVATLLSSGGVVSPSAPQTYGILFFDGSPVARPFTFMANASCGSNITATLSLQDGAQNLGTVNFSFPLGKLITGVTSFTQNIDGVITPALPSGWSTTASGAQFPWVSSSAAADTPPNALFAPDPNGAGLSALVSQVIPITSASARLTFWQNYNLEAAAGQSSTAFDGGVLDIQIGGNGFKDILEAGGSFVTRSYDHMISASSSNPLAGRQVWSGDSRGFVRTIVNLPPTAARQNVQLRWVCGSDTSNSGSGWYIDSVSIVDDIFSCCTSLVAAVVITDVHISGGNANFSFQSISGQSYEVEYKNALTNGNWNTLQSFTGDGTIITIIDPLSAPQRYYRIRSP